jgi:hypothetical protein
MLKNARAHLALALCADQDSPKSLIKTPTITIQIVVPIKPSTSKGFLPRQLMRKKLITMPASCMALIIPN